MKSVGHLFGFLFTLLGLFVFSYTSAFADDFGFAAHNGKTTGTVHLVWMDKDYVESYNIAYGTAPGSYQYGVTNVGNISEYMIGGLTPGQRYYFVLSPVDDGHGMAYTYEVSAIAGGSATSQTATTHTTPTTTAAQPSTPTHATTPTTHSTTSSSTMYESAPQMAVNEDKNFHLTAQPGPEKGTVTLMWDNKGYTDNYNIVYGPGAGQYVWGAAGIGHVGMYTIGALTSGQRYYFALSAVDDGTAMPYTPYVSIIAP